MNNKSKVLKEYTAEEIFLQQRLALWGLLPKVESPIVEALKVFKADYEDMVHTPPDMENVMQISKTLGIPINRKEYIKVTSSTSDTQNDYDATTVGFYLGLQMMIPEIDSMLKAIADGKSHEIFGEMYVIDGITNPYVENIKEDIGDFISNNLETLMEEYYVKIDSPFVDAEAYVTSEINNFGFLFGASRPDDGWKYLSFRFATTIEEIEELWQNRHEIIHGTYYNTLFDFNIEKRAVYAKLLLAKEYINFLKGERSETNLKQIYNPTTFQKPDFDDRIVLNEKEQKFIKACFELLLLDKNFSDKDDPMMKDEDLDYFLRANFIGFGEKLPRKKFKCPFDVKQHFISYIREILNKMTNTRIPKDKLNSFRNLIPNNFEGLDGGVAKNITDNFGRKLKNYNSNLCYLIKRYKDQFL